MHLSGSNTKKMEKMATLSEAGVSILTSDPRNIKYAFVLYDAMTLFGKFKRVFTLLLFLREVLAFNSKQKRIENHAYASAYV